MTSEYECVNCGQVMVRTRTMPDVPELVRKRPAFNMSPLSGCFMVTDDKGGYVRHDQAAAVIAAKDDRLRQSEQDKVGMLAHIAELEAKLAQIEEPEPDLQIWVKVDEKRDGSQDITVTDAIGFSEVPDGEYLFIRPNAPVASDADLRAENERLREALEFYADTSKYPAPLTGGMGALWEDCGEIARASLNPSEPRT